MSKVVSYSVGDGDMFCIEHLSDNFTIIDCDLSCNESDKIIKHLKSIGASKGISRFISTHPDMDHLRGLKELNKNLPIFNFYCVENQVKKEIFSRYSDKIDFLEYCSLKKSDKKFNISKDCGRKWMNRSSEERDSAGIEILWPNIENLAFKDALIKANNGESPNNISAIIRYKEKNQASFIWMGDLDTKFMEKIDYDVDWRATDILFAPHHGRKSGRIPSSILKKIDPKIIIIGEAPSKHINYYSGYNTITQNKAGHLIFNCNKSDVDIYATKENYKVDFLENKGLSDSSYLGTLANLHFEQVFDLAV